MNSTIRFRLRHGHSWKACAGLLALCLTAPNASAEIFSIVSDLGGSAGQGGGVRPVSDGTALYGMTRDSVFRVNLDGTGCTRLLWYHENDTGPSQGGLTISGSTLYVAAWSYGTYQTNYGHGAVFKLNTDGSGLTMLKQFAGETDGDHPCGAPMLQGNTLFGATSEGVVFKLNTDGSAFTVLKHLDGYTAGDLLLSSGKIYGTTADGGSSHLGSLFSMNLDGTGFKVLHDFTGGAAGASPEGALTLGGNTLYGVTRSATTYGSGTLFRINADGSDFTMLHQLTNGCSPAGNMVLGGALLYGATIDGGASGCGTLFRIRTNGSDFVTLKHFNGTEGASPRGGLTQFGEKLYGTTYFGGSRNSGVLFSLLVHPTILLAPQSQTAERGSAVGFNASATPPPLDCQWFFNETDPLGGATNWFLELPAVQPSQAGAYTVVVSNAFGAVTSPPAMLNVITPVERRPVPAITLMGDVQDSLHLDYSDALSPAPAWLPLDTVPLATPPRLYFDLTTPLPPQRFYRAWQSGSPVVVPTLTHSGMVPALTMTGVVGGKVRVDGINRVGLTDAWFTLGTVTLTNPTQLYFDTSAIGQPSRLYRLVPLP